jgi:hypothetical protein
MATPLTPVPSPSSMPALVTRTPSDLRDELTTMVVRDLLGPAGGPDEELNQYEDHVYQRYLVGMLAPKGEWVDAGQQDELATGGGRKARTAHRNPGCLRAIPISRRRWA